MKNCMKTAVVVLICAALFGLSPARAGMVTILAGDIDNVASTGDPADVITMRPDFDTALMWESNNSFYYSNGTHSMDPGVSRAFDEIIDVAGTGRRNNLGTPVTGGDDGNHTFGYSFQDARLSNIDASAAVTLTAGLKADVSSNNNDTISLQYTGTAPSSPTSIGTFEWGAGLISLGAPASWSNGASVTLGLDLKNLPVTGDNLVPSMLANGYLDVYIQDDTAVDYLQLDFTTVPEPSTATLITYAGLLAGLLRRRR